MTPEEDQYLQLSQSRAYYQGLREGIKMYAHWRDGLQYVGTTGKSLKDALNQIDIEEKELFEKYEKLLRLL